MDKLWFNPVPAFSFPMDRSLRFASRARIFEIVFLRFYQFCNFITSIFFICTSNQIKGTEIKRAWERWQDNSTKIFCGGCKPDSSRSEYGPGLCTEVVRNIRFHTHPAWKILTSSVELGWECVLRPTVSRPVRLGIGLSLGAHDQIYFYSYLVVLPRPPSLTRGRVCNLQCNRCLVRSLWTNNHTLPSHLRLCSLFVASYDSQGMRWRYYNPPPHGVAQLILFQGPLIQAHAMVNLTTKENIRINGMKSIPKFTELFQIVNRSSGFSLQRLWVIWETRVTLHTIQQYSDGSEGQSKKTKSIAVTNREGLYGSETSGLPHFIFIFTTFYT
jgi:hypothetical protein